MKKSLLLASLLLAAPLAAETKVLAFAGSTREDSYNKKLVKVAAEIARQNGAKVVVVDLKDFPMPFYDGDHEKNLGMPSNAKRLRQLMIESNAILIASPEYNGTVSAVLKNALDWASRSEQGGGSRDAFKGKLFAIMSASPGQGGGARNLATLRAIIEDVGGKVVQKQVSISNAHNAFDANGQLIDNRAKQALQEEVQQLFQPAMAPN